jgi:hypothetical protein
MGSRRVGKINGKYNRIIDGESRPKTCDSQIDNSAEFLYSGSAQIRNPFYIYRSPIKTIIRIEK